ncbi:MAG: hypothetical protein JXR48_17820 [Candidatus Delongbacteria bacterium]|nr:hypothetical protein [Candidatus Delongbacteria bacterium]MBN2836817.1 hypothetical protein [Candidatus Delongbacteria bacterium]
MKCYEKINCPFNNGTAPEGVNCPVFDKKISCWEFDWVKFYNDLPDGTDKEQWKCGFMDYCKNCELYSQHKEKMDSYFESMI